MVRFAHISDVHLGAWKSTKMQELNFEAFRIAVKTSIEKKVDFVLIAGDLFDSAYPGIEILKETFSEFRKLSEAQIKCFIIAGSHDYSVSGKTFLDVLERAGFCKNISNFVDGEEKIILEPVIHKGVALYGYPGKKSSLEITDLRRIKLNDTPGLFKIFALHTTIDKAKGTLPIDSIETENLPHADYYAMGHLHIDFQYKNFVYPGPLFPNNFQELEDLKHGGFYIVDTERENPLEKIKIKIKDIVSLKFEFKDTIGATDKIINELNNHDLTDKIVLLRIEGELENGKNSDINFLKIEEFANERGTYFVLRNTHGLNTKEIELEREIATSENVEAEAIKIYSDENTSEFNELVPQLINSLQTEKQEGETSEVFTTRLMEEMRKILGI